VEGDAELVCLPTAGVGRPLPNTLALADRNTLHPFQFEKMKKKACLCAPSSLRVSSFLVIFVPTMLVLGEHRHTCIADGADSGAGGG
jgi:hypothetical protein